MSHNSLARGYFLEASKSIFVAKLEDMARSKEVLRKFNFKYTDRNWYICKFIGSTKKIDEWLTPQIEKGVAGIQIIGQATKKYPQTAYSRHIQSLQMEWTYLQRVVPGTEAAFAPIKKALTEDFLPALLGDNKATATSFRNRHASWSDSPDWEFPTPSPMQNSDTTFQYG